MLVVRTEEGYVASDELGSSGCAFAGSPALAYRHRWAGLEDEA